MVRRSLDPRIEKEEFDREIRASSFVRAAMWAGLPISFVSDTLSGRIRSYGERYFESPGLVEMLTDGMLASSLLRPASSSARRWVAENIDALDRDDATAILRLSALDARDIEQALEQCLPRIRMGNAERISDYEHGWLRHIAADMKVSILRSLVAPMGKPKISAMLDDLVLRLATGNVAEIVKNLLAGDPTV